MLPALAPLLTRRSTALKDLRAPAPSEAELEQILCAATRVPDHGKLCPWRIVVLRGEGALKLGKIAAGVFAAQHDDASEAQLEAERNRFARAPLCLAVLSTPQQNAKPVWEQELSAGAVCGNILHAAHALGYGAKWLTEWVAYDAAILDALLSASPTEEATRLNERSEFSRSGEGYPRIAGFIYLGTKTSEPEDRERPRLVDVVGEFR